MPRKAKHGGWSRLTLPGTTSTALALPVSLMSSKGSDRVAPDTLCRHEAVLTQLEDFCAGRGIKLLKDIALSVVTEWQHTWPLKSPAAKRGRQEKVGNFFRFAVNHEYISRNPISAWKSVKLDTNDLRVSEDRIIRSKVYARIMKAVDQARLRALTQFLVVKRCCVYCWED
jgi:site-specific recombinase XerD